MSSTFAGKVSDNFTAGLASATDGAGAVIAAVVTVVSAGTGAGAGAGAAASRRG